MKRLIWVLFAIAALSATLSAFAAYHKGQVLNHFLSVCLDKQDGVDVANASDAGPEKADEAFTAKERCANVPVQGATVGGVVYKSKTASVVELKADGVIGYFITRQPVGEYKPENNS